jgi:toxin ParE1/3/4
MTRAVEYRFAARDDIDEAYSWYEEHRVGLGEEFLAAVRAAVSRIEAHPKAFAIFYRRARACPLNRFPFIIYYRIDPGPILVVAVLHGRRSRRKLRGRLDP